MPYLLLSNDEITTINSNFLMIENAITDLNEVINEPYLGRIYKMPRLLTDTGRIVHALDNLRPLVTHLFELQKEES